MTNRSHGLHDPCDPGPIAGGACQACNLRQIKKPQTIPGIGFRRAYYLERISPLRTHTPRSSQCSSSLPLRT